MTSVNKHIFSLLVVAFSCVLNSAAQEYGSADFKKKFNKADALVYDGSFLEALPLLEDLYRSDSMNANVNHLLGICYLRGKNDHQRAIDLLESAARNVAAPDMYQEGNWKEKKAPGITYYYLGKAYHYKNRFDRAVSNYYNYRSFISLDDVETYNQVRQQIQYAENAMELVKNPVGVKVKNLGPVVNTKYPEYCPAVSADGNTLIFTSRREGGTTDNIDDDGRYFEDIYVSTKKGGKWSKPVSIGSNINTAGHESAIGLSPDGQLLFIYKDDNNDGNIYQSERNADGWSDPVSLGSDINTDAWETHASITADKEMLVFTSNRSEGGYGGRDLWYCKKLPNGEWGLAMNMGSVINTDYEEDSPFISADGKTLVFSSMGHTSMGGFDIFRSKWEDGAWTAPENIGYPINTSEDDVFFVLNPDGRTAYYSSRMDGGFGDTDIYWLKLEAEQSDAMAVLTGMFKVPAADYADINVRIEVSDASGAPVGTYRPNQNTGGYAVIVEPNNEYKLSYLADGYEPVEKTVPVSGDESYADYEGAIELEEVVLGEDILALQKETERLKREKELAAQKAEEEKRLAEEAAALAARREQEVADSLALAQARAREVEKAEQLAVEEKLTAELALTKEKIKAQQAELERKKKEALARYQAQQEASANAETEGAENTARLKAEQEAQAKAEAERKSAEDLAAKQAEEEARVKAEQEAASLKEEQEAQAKVEAERKAAEDLATKKAEEAARIKAEQEAIAKAEAERLAAEEAARLKAEKEAQAKAEAERKAAEELAAKQAEEAARVRSELEAKLKAEEERKAAEAAARLRAEQEASAQAEMERSAAENLAARQEAEQQEAQRKADLEKKREEIRQRIELLRAQQQSQEEEVVEVKEVSVQEMEAVKQEIATTTSSIEAKRNAALAKIKELKKQQEEVQVKKVEDEEAVRVASELEKAAVEKKQELEGTAQKTKEEIEKLEAELVAVEKKVEDAQKEVERAKQEVKQAEEQLAKDIEEEKRLQEEERKKAEEAKKAAEEMERLRVEEEKRLREKELEAQRIEEEKRQEIERTKQELIQLEAVAEQQAQVAAALAIEERKRKEIEEAEAGAYSSQEILNNAETLDQLRSLNQQLIQENLELKKQLIELNAKLDNILSKLETEEEINKIEIPESTTLGRLKSGNTLILRNIFFDYNQSTLRTRSRHELRKLFEFMQSNPSVSIQVSGHTDSKGDDDYNMRLSRDRAQAVVDYLVRNGISSKRLSAVGYGETRPIARNENADGSDNAVGRQLNRRIEISIPQGDIEGVKIESVQVPAGARIND